VKLEFYTGGENPEKFKYIVQIYSHLTLFLYSSKQKLQVNITVFAANLFLLHDPPV
jgi:hypothetical protein